MSLPCTFVVSPAIISNFLFLCGSGREPLFHPRTIMRVGSNSQTTSLYVPQYPFHIIYWYFSQRRFHLSVYAHKVHWAAVVGTDMTFEILVVWTCSVYLLVWVQPCVCCTVLLMFWSIISNLAPRKWTLLAAKVAYSTVCMLTSVHYASITWCTPYCVVWTHPILHASTYPIYTVC